jgi:predicted transcriptional regulator
MYSDIKYTFNSRIFSFFVKNLTNKLIKKMESTNFITKRKISKQYMKETGESIMDQNTLELLDEEFPIINMGETTEEVNQ